MWYQPLNDAWHLRVGPDRQKVGVAQPVHAHRLGGGGDRGRSGPREVRGAGPKVGGGQLAPFLIFPSIHERRSPIAAIVTQSAVVMRIERLENRVNVSEWDAQAKAIKSWTNCQAS